MTENLFNEFPHASKQEWIELATKDLKGQDFEQKLITKSIEGFPILPFYTDEDSATFSWLQSYNNLTSAPSDVPGMSPRIWHNAVSISTDDIKAAAEEIKFVLDNGADALVLEVEGKIDYHNLLKDVLPQYIQIWLKPTNFKIADLEDFFEWFSHKGLRNADLSGGLIWDSFSQAFLSKIDKEVILNEAHQIHKITQSYPNFKGICLDAAVYHNAGGHAVHEIGYNLALAIDVLDSFTEAGLSANGFFSNFFVKTAMGSNYFMELAKVKTFRIAFHQLSALYDLNINPVEISVFAETSKWTKSALDPYNNIIRNTSEAMAAIIGGCNTLQVHPHDSGYHQPDTFSKRMARNISSILSEESYFDKVLDPSAGSYYVESLINNLYQDSLSLLKEIESLGGWWAAYQKHILQESIRQVRKAKHSQLSSRKAVQVGVNSYVNASDTSEVKFTAVQEEEYQLKPNSLSDPFIELKAYTDAFFKDFPKHNEVKLLALSPQARPRIEFSRNFFETAGFKVNETKDGFDEIAEVGLNSNESILVLCGTDEDYEKKAVQLAKVLGNVPKKLVLAGYPQDLVTPLIDAGLKTFIHLKTNVTETIFQITEDLKSI